MLYAVESATLWNVGGGDDCKGGGRRKGREGDISKMLSTEEEA